MNSNHDQAKWWREIQWNGLKAQARRQELVRLGRLESGDTVRLCEPFTWAPWCIPSESQKGPSCAGHGMVNFKEIMLRRYAGISTFKMWQQLDGDAVWYKARQMFYGGDLNGGLYIPQAFHAALAMGIFAPGSKLKGIPRVEALYSNQFINTPFIDGHDVSGWVKHGINDVNGQVYESGVSDGTGGHCTVRASRMTQAGRNYVQYLNSWGVQFAWHGLFIMSEELDERTALDDQLYYVEEPQGWEQWDGWKRYVINNA